MSEGEWVEGEPWYFGTCDGRDVVIRTFLKDLGDGRTLVIQRVVGSNVQHLGEDGTLVSAEVFRPTLQFGIEDD